MNGKLNLPINTVIGVSLLVLLLVPALYFAKPVLLPMVISTFVALLFSPLINYFEDKGLATHDNCGGDVDVIGECFNTRFSGDIRTRETMVG